MLSLAKPAFMSVQPGSCVSQILLGSNLAAESPYQMANF